MDSHTQNSPEMNNFKKNSPLIKKVKDLKFQDDKNKEIIKTQYKLIDMLKEENEKLKTNLKIGQDIGLKLQNRTIELKEELMLKDEIIRLHEST